MATISVGASRQTVVIRRGPDDRFYLSFDIGQLTLGIDEMRRLVAEAQELLSERRTPEPSGPIK